ncbi:MAG: hypothetical protein ACK5Z5_04980 [Neisseriaceae bacterium]|jgi:rubrerythrin
MVTLVGTQSDFNDVVIALLELEYDATEAYRLAVKKLSNTICKVTINEFLSDHERHIKEIKIHYSDKLDLPDSADLIKGSMAKLKVLIGDITDSDINILRAMLDNEKDTNTAYERVVNHSGIPDTMKGVFIRAYDDEKRHKKWLEDYISGHK